MFQAYEKIKKKEKKNRLQRLADSKCSSSGLSSQKVGQGIVLDKQEFKKKKLIGNFKAASLC
jgi:hypothetical protein